MDLSSPPNRGDSSFQGDVEVVVGTVNEPKPTKPRVNPVTFASLALALIAALVWSGASLTAWMVLGFLLSITASWAGFNVRATRRSVTDRLFVNADRHAIRVRSRPSVSCASIARACYLPRPSGLGSVRCVDASGAILFEAVMTDVEATSFLSAIGHDAGHRRLAYSIASGLAAVEAPGVAFPTTLIFPASVIAAWWLTSSIGASLGWRVGITLAASILAVVSITRTTSIEVGMDGLAWSKTGRFVSYEDIHSIEKVGSRGIRILTTQGRAINLTTSDARAERDELLLCIQQAMRARTPGSGATVTNLLRREGRSVAEWRRHLASVGAGDYRTCPVTEETLWNVVEDATAPEDARAGAAALLRSRVPSEDASASGEATRRLRVAAEAVASPRLRVALETSALPELREEDLERTLGDLRDDASSA